MQQPAQQIAETATAGLEGPATGHEAEERVMGLLHDHVPLSLLVDLAQRGDVDSKAILDTEGEPDDRWWESGAS